MAVAVELLAPAVERLRGPVVIINGAPRGVAALVQTVRTHLPADAAVVCYQMDVYQAGRLETELAALGTSARIAVHADLWDLPAEFATALYPVPARGERELKLDLVDQAYQVLTADGQLLVLSEHEHDDFFPPLLKKFYGSFGSTKLERRGTTFWAKRGAERPRRRHEVKYQARFGAQGSLQFLTRPGVFTYGRLDDGARALLDELDPPAGARILDMGCGTGVAGVIGGLRAGPTGAVVFVDSNVRACELARLNANAHALPHFDVRPLKQFEGLDLGSFDVALANPPYYAQLAIARLFMEKGRQLLKPAGQFYLVTKQVNLLLPLLDAAYEELHVGERRGYQIVLAERPRRELRAGADSGYDFADVYETADED
jgi:16S rRNA (guanine1207-N2)-methyltransferase